MDPPCQGRARRSTPARAKGVCKRPAAGDVGEYSSTSALATHPVALPVAPDVGEYSSTEALATHPVAPPVALVAHPAAVHVGEHSATRAPVTRRVRQRPAAVSPAEYEDLSAQSLPQASQQLPEWVCMAPDGDEMPRLPWADHIVHTLVSNGHLPRSSRKKVELQMWTDCSGINSEKFAWNELQDAMCRIIGAHVSLMLYYTCDSDAKSLAFAKANHHPKHVSSNMTQRNFTSGLFWCTLHEANFPIPRSGVDLYVGTYPCSPWSRRGLRTGWDHPSVEAFRIGLQTIGYTRPAVWIIELGELPESASLDEILSDIQSMLAQEDRQYIIQVVRSMGPQTQGYPIKRTRTYFLGWRNDVAPFAEVVQPLHTLIRNPVDVTSSYRGFLKIAHPYDWSGVGNFCVGASLEYLSQSACCCSCNPYALCPVHKCKCDKCGPDGLQCAWRLLLQQMLEKENLVSQAGSMEGKMTYINALEMQGGVAPPQARGRTLLNIVALLPGSQPLRDTLMLVDKSQNPHFGSWPTDGMAPTLTTTSQLWCMSAGRELEAWELAALMGFDMNKMVLKDQTEAWFRRRLGLAVHVPNFGLILAAALAHPLQACLAMP